MSDDIFEVLKPEPEMDVEALKAGYIKRVNKWLDEKPLGTQMSTDIIRKFEEPPRGVHPSIMSVFLSNKPKWKYIKHIKSERKVCGNRPIALYEKVA